MKEDINVLNNMIEKSKSLREEDFYKIIGIKQLQALFNLIQAYKEQQVELEVFKQKEEFYTRLSNDNDYFAKELEKKNKMIDEILEILKGN